MSGFDGVVSVATLQFPESLFVAPLDWKTVPGDIETSQLRTLFAVVECAQQAGLVLAWEQLLSTPLLPVCDHRVAFRLHIIAQCPLKRLQFEELIVMACKGDMRDGGKTSEDAWSSETGDRNAAKRRKHASGPPEPSADAPCLPEHYRFIRVSDIRRTLGVMTFGSEDAEPYEEFTTDTGPRVEEEGSDGTDQADAVHRGGIFESFAIYKILPSAEDAPSQSASKSRFDDWRVWNDEETGHDPREWASYVDQDDGDCRWFVSPEYGEKAIRYVNFSSTSKAFRWFKTVADLKTTAKPWERPSPDDVRRCIMKFSSSSDLAVPALQHLSHSDLYDMVEELKMYENDMPITATQAVAAADVDGTVQARLYPHTERLRQYFADFMDRVTQGVRMGVLDASEIELAEATCLTRLDAQFTRDIEGYCSMPHCAMLELSNVIDTLNQKMQIEERGSGDVAELKTLRKMAFNPKGVIHQLHEQSIDVLHTLGIVRDYEGMNSSQTRGLTLVLCHSGLNYRPAWDAHARYFLFTGFPGGGKSELMSRYRQWMPNGAVVQLDMVSQKALYYNGKSLDMKVVTLDENPGQVKGQEWLIQAINTCVSKGYMDYTTAVYEPKVRDDGTISSVGGSYKISAAARTVWLGACNTRIIDEAGAAKDRRTEVDIIKTGDEPKPPPGARTVVSCARLIHKAVTLTMGYAFFAAMYGIIVSETPVMTIFDVFVEMVIKRVPELSRFYLRHRQKETLRALAIRNWMARHALNHLFPHRNSKQLAWATEEDKDDKHRFRRIPGKFFTVRKPDINYLRTLATSTITAVDCVVALAMLQESDTMYRRFLGILIEHLSIHLGDFVRSESPEDEEYRKTSFLVSGADLRLPAVLVAKCEKERIPGFSQHKIVQEGISTPVYSGSPAFKIETNPAGKNPSLMVHSEALKKGFRTPSAGQLEILRRIWACDAAWDFEEQKTAVISHELWKETVQKDDGSIDLVRENLAIDQWEMEPGRPCIKSKDDSIGGTGYLNVEVAVVIHPQPGQTLPDGYGVARDDGPLGAEEQQVPIKPKMLSKCTVIDGDFYRLIPAILAGKDVCGRNARVHRKQRINRFLLAAGVKPGAVVFGGTYDLPTARGDIADLHTVEPEEFMEQVPNPRFVRRHGMYNGGASRPDPVFSPDEEHIQFSETSQFDDVIGKYVREEYTKSRRPPDLSQTMPGQNRFSDFFGFDE